MILPIVPYGDPVLRKAGQEVEVGNAEIQSLIANMTETMHNASGVGLAAPQVGESLRLFVIDGAPMAYDEEPELKTFQRVMVNPRIEEAWGEEWGFEEGCLSIPGVRQTVYRPEHIRIRYTDADGEEHSEELSGLRARITQHEFDHIEGILFTDLLPGLKKQLIRGKLSKIQKGKIKCDYPLRPIPKRDSKARAR